MSYQTKIAAKRVFKHMYYAYVFQIRNILSNILVSNDKVFIYLTNGMTKIYIKTCNWALLYTSGLRSAQYTSQ